MELGKGKFMGRLKKILLMPSWLVFLLVVISVVIVFFVISNQIDILPTDVPSWLDSYLKIVGAGVAFGVALWRWSILKRKSDDDSYLKTIEILTDAKSQAAFIGATHSLLDLSKRNPKKYIRPAVTAIESAIREFSLASLNDWVEKSIEGNPHKDRKRTPAIIEMVRVMLDLRSLADKNSYNVPLPDIDLGDADLRGLCANDIKGRQKYFKGANLRKADLRYVALDEEFPLEFVGVDGAWISIDPIEYIINNCQEDKLKELDDAKKSSINRSSTTKTPIIWGRALDSMEESNAKLMRTKLYLIENWSKQRFEFYVDELIKDGIYKDKLKIDIRKIFEKSRIGGAPGVRLDDMALNKCSFRDALLVEASFRKAELKEADFTGADLRKADFSGAILHNATFSSAKTDGAIFTDESGEEIVDGGKLREFFRSLKQHSPREE